MKTTLIELLALSALTSVTAAAAVACGGMLLFLRNVAHGLPRAAVSFVYAAWLVFGLLAVCSGALTMWRAAGGQW